MVHFYLCGSKGLAAFRAIPDSIAKTAKFFIERDLGVLDSSYDLLSQEISQKGFEITHPTDVHQSDFALAVGWKKLIKQNYKKLFVIHDSLLPKYRGWNPLVTAIQKQEPIVGVTLIQANEEVDAGPIIFQREVEISFPVKIQFAIEQINKEIGDLVKNLFDGTNLESLEGVPQNDSEATYSLWRDDQDYKIDWSKSSAEIRNFVDSVGFPYYGASTSIVSESGIVNVRVTEVECLDDLHIVNRTSGKVWRVDSSGPSVICGRGILRIRKMTIADDPKTSYLLKRVRCRFV